MISCTQANATNKLIATPYMTIPSITPSEIRSALLLRDEIALLDLRHEAAFATGHPLFAANMAAGRIELEAAIRLPRKDVPIVLYDAGEGLVPQAADRFKARGYTDSQVGDRPATRFSRT
jgi:rhodanese-related sulfurtransferase